MTLNCGKYINKLFFTVQKRDELLSRHKYCVEVYTTNVLLSLNLTSHSM